MSKPTGFPPTVRDGILSRDLNMCAMIGARGCRGHLADEANHRLNRQAGGTHGVVALIVNSPANGCALEHGCNWRAEAVADFAAEARRRGVKIEAGADPRRVPIWLPAFRQWVALLDDGAHLTGVTDPDLDARDADDWLPAEIRALLPEPWGVLS